MDANEKVRENRLRRAAERRGLRLVKSRRRDPGALTFGRYWLTRPDGTNAAEHPTLRGFTLDEVEERLSTPTR